MKFSEAIKAMLNRSGLTYRNVAARISGESDNVAYVNIPIRRNNSTVEKLISIANACGYDVVLQPKECGVSSSQLLISQAGIPKGGDAE